MPPQRFDRERARKLHAAGLTQREIGAKLGVSQSAIGKVVAPRPRRRPKPTFLRLLAATAGDTESDCILFTGHIRDSGYATIWHEGRKQLVHRVAWQLIVGPIPEGYEVDHLCFVRHCVNPFHLEAVTPKVNTLRSSSVSAINAEKTHCDYGHEFTPANTRYRRDRHGRTCRICDARRAAEYRLRREAA